MTDPVLSDPQLPTFSSISPDRIKPELLELLNSNRQRIAKLVENPEATWDTLAQPMDDMSDQLNQMWSPVSHLNSVLNSDALREAYNGCIPELSQYSTEIGQNRSLYEAYAHIKSSGEFQRLNEAQQKSITNILRDFHLAGVDLADEKKAKYKEISQQLAELGSKFSDNVLDATQAWSKHLTSEEALKGLPKSALAGARQAAKSRNLEGYVLTLDFPSYYAVMTYAEDPELRREMYEAYNTRASDQGPHAGRYDNSRIMQDLLRLRREKALLLGFETFAHYSLATKMAQSPEEVLEFLNDLAEKSVMHARKEFAELEAFAREQGADTVDAWDVSYYAEKLKQERYAISEEELKPYFPAAKVINGMFTVVERLFGITLEEVSDFETYHPDVRYFRVKEDGREIASIYMDLYARENKRGGAWMADYAVRRRLDNGHIQKPVAFITCNFAPATDEHPALLTHNEVTTLFHEFGHALHHMLTQVDCYEVSGINGVAWDAVELPSQFLENWCWEEEALAMISGHYETGEPLPKDLLDKMLAAKNFQSAMMMVRQLEFALFDFRLHHEYAGEENFDILALMNEVRDKVAVIKAPAFNRFPHSFSHIFAGGYAAGYYSYKWAEVLAADAFSKFEENGVFDAKTGREFLHCILEKGGSREPMDLFVEFRGRPPKVDALLRHSGILPEAVAS
ncbi:oligopeptidase A [Hahella sp. CCB-MM4]|uniref:oligopeptidase A n=1 Tax=Hahella sp. (strain CCB-MM4) TaxID=1926491 RepID=UPI000B9B9251|nr:oligopeptidase A [Hahella sp. CCB-MM4]OZG73267.1 oligopeptidase A [Hahella sp. CCB-MM4]